MSDQRNVDCFECKKKFKRCLASFDKYSKVYYCPECTEAILKREKERQQQKREPNNAISLMILGSILSTVSPPERKPDGDEGRRNLP